MLRALIARREAEVGAQKGEAELEEPKAEPGEVDADAVVVECEDDESGGDAQHGIQPAQNFMEEL